MIKILVTLAIIVLALIIIGCIGSFVLTGFVFKKTYDEFDKMKKEFDDDYI